MIADEFTKESPENSSPLRDGRLGKFFIARCFLEEDYEAAKAVFLGGIVMRAEFFWATESVEYVMAAPQFDTLDKGMEIPEYRVAVSKNEDGEIIGVEWSR